MADDATRDGEGLGKRYPGLNTVKKRLSDGTVATYRYNAETSVRILAEPGTPEFDEQYKLAAQGIRIAPPRAKAARGRGGGRAKRQPAFVYLISARGTERLKIGKAVNLQSRLSQLQTGSFEPLDLIKAFRDPTGGSMEKRLHKELVAHRLRGEWFMDHADVRDAFDRATLSVIPPGSTSHRIWAEHDPRLRRRVVRSEPPLPCGAAL